MRSKGWIKFFCDTDGWVCGYRGVGVVYHKNDEYRIRKWNKGSDNLDPEAYATLEAAKFAVELKYG